MLEAQLHGKLSKEQENLEDILTSNVFGSFKYFHVREGLLPFLTMAKKPDGTKIPDSLWETVSASYRFWPKIEETGCRGCEPDVLIELDHRDEGKSLILIEAKYLSGKSSEVDEDDTAQENPPNDQLSREWQNLSKLAERLIEHIHFVCVIYVTADYACPTQDIEASQQELVNKGIGFGEIYWLSWRSLKDSLIRTNHMMLLDVRELMLDRYGLTYFEKLSINYNLRDAWRWNTLFNLTINSKGSLQWRYKK